MTINNIIHTKTYEHVIYVLRRHWVTFVPYILIFILLLFIPVMAYFFFVSAFATTIENPITFPALILFFSAYYLCLYLFFYSYFVAFYLDMWVVTNDRMVDIRQISLFARTISEVDLYQIQDVSSEVKGFFASAFNYGNVHLQTAGPVPKFIIYNVPNPDKVRQAIIELASEDKKYHMSVKK